MRSVVACALVALVVVGCGAGRSSTPSAIDPLSVRLPELPRQFDLDTAPPMPARLVVRMDGVHAPGDPPRQLVSAIAGVIGAEAGQGELLPFVLRDLRDGARAPIEPLVIAIDRDVPYRTVARVLYTAGQTGIERVGFVVLERKRERLLTLRLPSLADAAPRTTDGEPDRLGLLIEQSNVGYDVGGTGGVLETGCRDVGEARPTIPLWDGRPHMNGLTRCLARIKREFHENTACTITFAGDTPWRDVARTISVARGRPNEPLFPDVRLAEQAR